MAAYVFRQAVAIVVLSACQLAGRWLLFEENPAFHVNVIEVCNML
jgi:hypothetical protein